MAKGDQVTAPSKEAIPAASKSSGGVVRGASLLILLQVSSRALTFIANQVLLRFLTAQLLGISTQLEVYYLSVLFFARESLRVAIQRQAGNDHDGDDVAGGNKKKAAGDDDDDEAKAARAANTTQALVNLAYLAILMGIAAALILGRLYLSSVPAATLRSTPHLAASLRLYALAAVLELLSEPVFVVMQSRLDFAARAAAEGAATSLRCLATLGPAAWAARSSPPVDLGTLPFALGQLAYALGLLAVYLLRGVPLSRAERFSLLPRRLPAAAAAREYALSYFYRPTLRLAGSLIAQSFVKHVLTQGDTFLVSALSTPTAQGVYALANNYGGLVARLVLQPVEESSRNYFSRLLSSSSSASSASDDDSTLKGTTTNPAIHRASTDLTTLLRLYLTLSLPLSTIGPLAAPHLIALVAGRAWSSSGAGSTLALLSALYVPLLAINGVLEAFVASVATRPQLHAQSAWMAAFSLAFAASGVLLLRVLGWGARGLVLANAVNMACRIVWCGAFVRRYFAERGVRFGLAGVSPSATGWAVAAAAAAVLSRVGGGAVSGGSREALVELVKIGAAAVPFVVALAFAERNFIRLCYETVRGRRQGAAS